MNSKEVRKLYFNYFESKNHQQLPSSKIYLSEDPSLLFVNAGMNQFKDNFLGLKESPFKRAVNIQKCLRVSGKHNDLEDVGLDTYHHTFFEMMGVWSFKDYWKKESIEMVWEFVTNSLKLPKEKLYATVYEKDAEAYEYWKSNTDISPQNIFHDKAQYNFWEMGEVGPCGPCTEIHYDLGEEACSLKGKEHQCAVNGDCGRFIEIWNVVFISYNKTKEGSLEELSHKYVDMGMGLERLVSILQGKLSNYDTDIFEPYFKFLEKASGYSYSNSKEDVRIAMRVICDHIRAIVFTLVDGVIPSNNQRGYVIRRVLRRAFLYGKKLGLEKPFLNSMISLVVENMQSFYPELKEKETQIKEIVLGEENKFMQTLDKGLSLFEKEVKKLGDKKELDGSVAFLLYDTYGFPFDLSLLLAKEKGLIINEKEFDKKMDEQKQLAKANRKFSSQAIEKEKKWVIMNTDIKQTNFVGYEDYITTDAKVVKYSLGDENKIDLVLDKTTFYAESGGQIADLGFIYSDKCKIQVEDVQKSEGEFTHYGKIIEGEFDPKALYTTDINVERRHHLKKHHTGVHLLHSILAKVLKKPDLDFLSNFVGEDHFTCDIPNDKLTQEQIREVEFEMNAQIQKATEVETTILSLKEATEKGIIGRFSSKYKEFVRVVDMKGVSADLCGGTHVKNLGELGVFKLLTDASAGSGTRRLTGVCGLKAWEVLHDLFENTRLVGQEIKASVMEVPSRVELFLKEIKALKKELKSNRSQGTALDKNLINDVKEETSFKGVKVFIGNFKEVEVPSLRILSQEIFKENTESITILFSEIKGRTLYNIALTQSVADKGVLINDLSAILNKALDGRGGGKGLFATGSINKPYEGQSKEDMLKDLKAF